MKNLKNLGKALSKAEQKTVNGGRTPRPTTCPGCSHTYGVWLYSAHETGPGAACGFPTSNGNCFGVVQSNGTTCCAS